jgi:hypothetical protein
LRVVPPVSRPQESPGEVRRYREASPHYHVHVTLRDGERSLGGEAERACVRAERRRRRRRREE